MAQLTVSIITHDEEFKRQASQLLRAGGVPIGILESKNQHRRLHAGHHRRRHPVGRILGDVCHRAAAGIAAWHGDLRDRRGRRAGPDSSSDARRSQRVLPVASGRCDFGVSFDGGGVPRGRSADSRPARGRDRERQGAVRHAGLPGCQGRSRDDDGCGQLRRGAGAPVEAPDGHSGPQAVPGRGRSVSRRAPQIHRPRRNREPASPGQGLPQGARVAPQDRRRHHRRRRNSSIVRMHRTWAPSRSSCEFSLAPTTT